MDFLQTSSAQGFEYLIDEYVYYVVTHKNINVLNVNNRGDHYVRINAPLFSFPKERSSVALHNMLNGFEIQFLRKQVGAIVYYDGDRDRDVDFTYYEDEVNLENDWGSIQYTVKNYRRNLNAESDARAIAV